MQYMTHSVWKSKKNTCQTGQSVVAYLMFRTFLFCHTMAPRGNVRNKMRLLGQAVKTSPFHGGNTGSIPVGVIYADVAQLAEQLICNQQVIGSSPIIGLFLGT